MKQPRDEELQTIIAQGRLDRAVAILQRLDPAVAADTFMSLPYEQQQVLFRRLPSEFAAKLAPIFPYYQTFVLLHALSNDQMIAVVEKMNPIERSTFLDELPEEIWHQITSELEKKQDQRSASAGQPAIDGVAAPMQPIIEARGLRRASSAQAADRFKSSRRRVCRWSRA